MDVVIGNKKTDKTDQVKLEIPQPEIIHIKPKKPEEIPLPDINIKVNVPNQATSTKQVNIQSPEILSTPPKPKLDLEEPEPDIKVVFPKNELPPQQQVKIDLPEPEVNELPIQQLNQQIVPSIPVNIVNKIDSKEFSFTKENKTLNCKLIYYMQGDEEELEEEILNFFLESNPKIIYQTTWVIGIHTYFMFIYR